MSRPLRLAVTIGDINGIGPEVALKALYRLRRLPGVAFTLIGSAPLLRAEARRLGRTALPAPVWDPIPDVKLRRRPGRVDPHAGMAAAAWVGTAACACMRGDFDGLVTAPICKEAMQAANLPHPGHTEFLAGIAGTARFAMMLFGGPLRVVVATRHIPLRDVPAAITPDLLREQVELAAEGLPWLGCPRARIAVCGLNPHAGEGGRIGDEEIRTIAPVLKQLRRRGLDVHGPLAADTVFHRAARGDFDAVVALYHDQGLGPLKLLAFDSGVNVTLGLPFVRTSPDHGTAFDIAGKNRANPASMIEALRQAAAIARRRNPWRRVAP
jgi:4-hydroxythreonine-4-phosphate dehydrogenase